jgi:hypothetical protein
MAFHRGGAYAVNMGLDSDNVFRIGGWSAPANRLQMDMSGNLTMAGTLAGTNLSGTNTGDQTNISGNAATAGGFTPSQTNGTANRIVVADANGYINNNYFNSTDNSTASGVSAVMVKAGDNYLRSGTAAAVATFISGQSMNIAGSSTSCSGNAATASATLMSSGRTDATAYPVVWATTGANSQMYSCTAVNIQSSTGTLNATNLNATTGAFSGQVTQSGNSATIYGPNSSWASYLQVGGNGRTVSGINYASIATTNGNMHIDSGSSMAMYLNFYSGTAGINFGNGATGIIGTVSAAGALSMNGNITAYSDERLKKDWTPLVSDFVEKLAAVKAGTYTRIDSGERQAGSSAQDWQELLPEVVTEGADEAKTLALAYGNAALVSAVELAKRVVDQDMRIAKLEALVAQLTKNIAL